VRTPRVLLITDVAFSDDTVLGAIDAAARALPRGDFAVQLRDRTRSREDRAAWARRLRGVTRTLDVALIVNGDVGLAREVDADGIHFGVDATLDDVEAAAAMWRSFAAHRDEDVARARVAGVDAALVSPIFASPGKGAPRGTAALARAVRVAGERVAVIALGGVGEAEARACFEAGAVGVAVIRALLCATLPGEVARKLRAACAAP
jgi:thiamine-phosphate pyrophosphorylase